MLRNNSLSKAVNLLKTKCKVIPEKYTSYNGGFLFLAYTPGVKNKDGILNPYYLVDLKSNAAGPFSPAFDFDGFFEAVDKMKDLPK